MTPKKKRKKEILESLDNTKTSLALGNINLKSGGGIPPKKFKLYNLDTGEVFFWLLPSFFAFYVRRTVFVR